ncbi:MAG TPA: dihydropteroate synthase [Methanomassiliicoccales archaeon]|nr:dihydropteroate synthase [Methanomassiliicoccales archaeon]
MIVRVREYVSMLEAQAEWRRLGIESPIDVSDDLWQGVFMFAEGDDAKEIEDAAFLAEELGGTAVPCSSENTKRLLLYFESGLLRSLSCAVGQSPSLNEISQALNSYHGERGIDVPLPAGRLSSDGTLIMGVLNVTPDSFSDGGTFAKRDDAVRQAFKMADEGADIIDIGGESTRPYSRGVSPDEELKRVEPVLKELVPGLSVPVSIDTRHPEVAERAVSLGASIVNDVSGLSDQRLVDVAIRGGTAVVAMHMRGTPETMQDSPYYEDVVGDICLFLKKRVDAAVDRGLDRSKVILDPGIGFGKTIEHNLEILRRLKEFRCLGRPLMVGASRKAFVRKLSGENGLLEGSVTAAVLAARNGASIVRVHDVAETKRAMRLADAVQR